MPGESLAVFKKSRKPASLVYRPPCHEPTTNTSFLPVSTATTMYSWARASSTNKVPLLYPISNQTGWHRSWPFSTVAIKLHRFCSPPLVPNMLIQNIKHCIQAIDGECLLICTVQKFQHPSITPAPYQLKVPTLDFVLARVVGIDM